MTSPEIRAAELRAAQARERLFDTVGSLQTRLDPRTVARDAMDGITESGSKALGLAVDTASRNPGAIAGVAALLGVFAARRRIFAMLGSDKKSAKPAPGRRVRSETPRRKRRHEDA